MDTVANPSKSHSNWNSMSKNVRSSSSRRFIPLNKNPEVRPINIGEVIRDIIRKYKKLLGHSKQQVAYKEV